MQKIVYLIEQPLDERNYDRFGVQTWTDRNWIVEAWDLTPLAYPQAWANFARSGRSLRHFSGYFAITSRGELAERCARAGNVDYFIDFTGDNSWSLRAKRALVHAGARRVVCSLGSMPDVITGQKVPLSDRMRNVFGNGPVNACKRLINALARRALAPVLRPRVMVISGEDSVPHARPDLEVIKAHNFDYDIYLGLRQAPAGAPQDYAVFIDQNYCFHPDFVSQGTPGLVTPDQYFPALCRGLKAISAALRLAIEVAAHPRAASDELVASYFQELPLTFGKTAQLIQRSALVVCHNSTAIQFAVLFGKPAVFLTSNQLIGTDSGRSIEKLAAELGKTPINMDTDLGSVDWQRQLHVDSIKYSEYRRRYIKGTHSPDIPLWDIVVNHLEKQKPEQLSLCSG